MSIYANVKKYELRYSDFDFKDELKLSALLSLAQESAAASADELGFGYSDLKPRNLGFIVVQTYCEFRRTPALGDTLTVETWPLPPRHIFFERDYRVRDAEGEEIAAIASRWCFVDLGAFSLLTPDKLGEAHEKCPYRAEKSVEVPVWKIPRAGGREVGRVRAANGHCDHYLHVNNAQYADLFMDCFTMEELKNRRIKAFQISYSKQVKEGSEMAIFRADAEQETTLELQVNGEICTQFRVYFEKNQ